MTIVPKLAALAVVLRDDHVLLVKRRNEPDGGLWGFPGGHVDPGETALAAAVRELHEETGVRAHPEGYVTNVDVIDYDSTGELRFHFLLAAVLCTSSEGEPVANDDVSDARWVPVQEVMAGTVPCSDRVDDVIRLARARKDQG